MNGWIVNIAYYIDTRGDTDLTFISSWIWWKGDLTIVCLSNFLRISKMDSKIELETKEPDLNFIFSYA